MLLATDVADYLVGRGVPFRRAHEVVGCRDLSRVDLMLDGQHRPFLLEINTLPGLTNLSYFPKMAAHVGLAYPDLIESILDSATVKLQETQNP